MDEPRLLSWNWGDEGSVVTFRLEAITGGTRLILEHTGPEGGTWTCTGVGFESWVGAQDQSAVTGRARTRGIGTDAT